MSSITQWGTSTWILFHTMVEQLTEDTPEMVAEVFKQIVATCGLLPCPDCTQHATEFLTKKIDKRLIRTKNELRNVLFVFHNSVNSRKKKPLYKYDDLKVYNNINLPSAFFTFKRHFHTDGNMREMSQNMSRKRFLGAFQGWFQTHGHKFSPT